MSARGIGNIANYYGGLSVKESDGKFFWSIENYSGEDWQEIPGWLYKALIAFEDGDSTPPKGQAEAVAGRIADADISHDGQTVSFREIIESAFGGDNLDTLVSVISGQLAALTSPAPAGRGVEGWQDMSSAPKDGTRILLMAARLARLKLIPEILWIKLGSWKKHHQDGYEEGWREDAVACPGDTSRLKLSPTHWQPTPASPREGR